MAAKSKKAAVKPEIEESQAIEKNIPDSPPKESGVIHVKMACVDEKNEWNFTAENPPDAIEKGRVICQQNGYHFPSQVVVWEFS